MKTDDLEKFVSENRDGFDDFTPDPALWAQVQKNIKPTRSFSFQKVIYRAAAVIVIFILSYYYHDYRYENKQAALLLEYADPVQIENAKNFFEAKAYYASMIVNKEKEVSELTKDFPELRRELKLEFQEVDKRLSELQKDLKDEASNEIIIEAMIQNYRQKLSILEDILLALKNDNNDKNNIQHEI
ncbi:MAG: hypothetical protein CVU00_11520 [Bacteroidetes bacterium HGW-Bacteroidetes-17]|jgi:predicted transcriptional regulator|nr:MAG: hypothetical protein CVU00_11520 [Bacteroidetes bacterium HGW-Bacteroidetes-17]